MLDDGICDSNDEYNKDGYGSDEKGCKLFLDKRVNHEKRIMTKAKYNKICFWKTEVIDSFMKVYWDLNF